MSWEDSKYLKEQIISEAWSVARTDDFRWGSEEFQSFIPRWKDAGWAGPDWDSDLWDDFCAAKSEFHSRRIADKERRQDERDAGRRGKEQCISEARSLARSTDWHGTPALFQALREKFYTFNAGRDANQELKEQFNAEVQVFFDNKKAHQAAAAAERDAAASKKESLISEARSLARSTEWKATGQLLTELRDRFFKAGYAGKDRNAELKAELDSVIQIFFNNRTAHFEQVKRERAEAVSAKERILSEARGVAQSNDWNETKTALMALKDKLMVPNAGRDENKRCTDEFNAIFTGFVQRRTAFFQKRDAERKEVVRKKENIIARAKNLVNPSDVDKAWEDMKDLLDEWRSSGRAGAQLDADLNTEFFRIRNNLKEHRTAWKAMKHNQNTTDPFQRDLQRELKNRFDRPEQAKWADYMETGRDGRGNVTSRSTIGSDAYVHSTGKKDHTTGHASGDIHKHGSHSDRPNKGNFNRGNPPPSGKIIDEYLKKPK